MTIHQRGGRISPQPGPSRTQDDPLQGKQTQETDGTDFDDYLKEAKSDGDDITLSAHAKKRIAQRNISLDASERQTLSDAMQTLEDNGAQDAAVLRDDAAFVVNVPNRTVVTALDQAEMQRRVFTQIDSAMTV